MVSDWVCWSGLVQDRSIYIALAIKVPQSCTKLIEAERLIYASVN